MERGNLRLLLKITGVTLLCFLVLPTPSEMTSFWIGCSTGNFQASNTCIRICNMLGQNFSGCCYGVNHAGRSACACCKNIENNNCPQNCAANCVMVSINCDNCAGGNVLGELPTKEGDMEEELNLNQFYNGLDLIPVQSQSQFRNKQCGISSGHRDENYCPF